MKKSTRTTRIGSIINGWRIVKRIENNTSYYDKYEAVCVNCGQQKTIGYYSIKNQTIKFCSCQSCKSTGANNQILDPLIGTTVNGWKIYGLEATPANRSRRYILRCLDCGEVKSAQKRDILNKSIRFCHCIYHLAPRTECQKKIYDMFIEEKLSPNEIARKLGSTFNNVSAQIGVMMKHYCEDQVKNR